MFKTKNWAYGIEIDNYLIDVCYVYEQQSWVQTF